MARTRVTHGMSKTRPYEIWIGVKKRCDNPKHKNYDRYGGRGIKYCNRWSKFENFWTDMKDGYNDTLTIDRINNNGNYSKANCKWTTRYEQSNNTSKNRKFEFRGRLWGLSEFATKHNIGYRTLLRRVQAGWVGEELLLPKNTTIRTWRLKNTKQGQVE